MMRFKSSAARLRAACLILGLVAAAVAVPVAWAELEGPTRNDLYVTKAVTTLLPSEHLSRHALNDEMAERCVKSFLKTLDPMKVYFNQSDVDGFLRRQHELDDMATKGDISFAYNVFNTFLKRIDDRLKVIDEMLATEHDFTVDEEMITDPDATTYALNDAEARELWRKRIKYDLLVQKTDKVEGKEARDKLHRRYHSFARRMQQIDTDELLEMYLTSFTTAYDPHTTYMSPSSLENFEIQMRLELDGIGAALQSVDGYTVVGKIIPGGAADKDGRLKPEDKVVAVGQGEGGEMVDVIDMKLSDVVDMIRGKRDTVVRLKVQPADGGEAKVYDITRARIELKDSEARSEVIETGRKSNGQSYKIGFIDLPSFYMDMDGARKRLPDYKSTTRDVRKILESFQEKQIDAVILDLRKNGGGSLTEAINLTGLFIDEGPIVQVKDADGNVQHYDDLEKGVAWEGPLVVLTSKFSASASEIFAGAIQDYGRGLIVGDHSTHGKGTVQSLLDLGRQLFRLPNAPKLGALKLTMQQFYRPNGDSTQNRGVLADVELPSITTHLDVAESDLDYAMKFDKVDAAEYKKVNYVDRTVLDQLRRLSAERRERSSDFQKLTKDIERYQAQKKRKTVSLNEEKFMAERAELDARKEEEKKLEELNNSQSDEIVKKDYYFHETVAVTLDYLQLFNLAQAR
jgi:carboxyl-terminal processing protease